MLLAAKERAVQVLLTIHDVEVGLLVHSCRLSSVLEILPTHVVSMRVPLSLRIIQVHVNQGLVEPAKDVGEPSLVMVDIFQR